MVVIPGAGGEEEKDLRVSGSYEPLHGNIYNTLDEPPPLPPDRPVTPVSADLDDDGYLRVRDTMTEDPDQEIPASEA